LDIIICIGDVKKRKRKKEKKRKKKKKKKGKTYSKKHVCV
jgi:hypothetical protein